MQVDYMKNIKAKKATKRRHSHIPTFKEMEQALNIDMQNSHLIKVKNI